MMPRSTSKSWSLEKTTGAARERRTWLSTRPTATRRTTTLAALALFLLVSSALSWPQTVYSAPTPQQNDGTSWNQLTRHSKTITIVKLYILPQHVAYSSIIYTQKYSPVDHQDETFLFRAIGRQHRGMLRDDVQNCLHRSTSFTVSFNFFFTQHPFSL